MKRNILYALGAAVVLSFSLNSCAELNTEVEPSNKLQVTDSMGPQERMAILYLSTLNIFNDICNSMNSGTITEAQALKHFKSLNKLMNDFDSSVWGAAGPSNPVWGIITGPKYGAEHDAIMSKVSANLTKAGVIVESENAHRNNPLQSEMYTFACMMYHAG